MKFVVLLFFLTFYGQSNAQRLFNSVKKISNGNGTFFMHWGYNRTFYSQSDIQFKDKEYDFTLRNVVASDQPTKKFGDYVRITNLFNPQFSVKAGYYYMNRYALTFGMEHMKYVLNDGNSVLLDGEIDTSLHAIWQGKYKNENVITNATDFHYQNVGLNLIHIGLIRTDKLYQSKNKTFALCASYGLQLGGTVSNSTLNFANKTSTVRSFSGYGISALANLRFEMFRAIYIQAQLVGGSMNQIKARTDASDLDAFAKNQVWYGQRQITVGFFHFFKPGNSCNDCPVW